MKKQVSKASAELITLSEIKAHLRIDHDLDNTILAVYRDAATTLIEKEIAGDIQATVWAESYDTFDREFYVDYKPITAISKIEYYNSANALTEFTSTNYLTYIPMYARSVIQVKDDFDIPEIYNRIDAVIVTYTSGFAVIPPLLKAANLLQIGSFYEHRENETELSLKQLAYGVERICAMYREAYYA